MYPDRTETCGVLQALQSEPLAAGFCWSVLTHRSTASLSNGLAYQLVLLSAEWVIHLDFPTGQSCMITSSQ